MKKRYYLIFSIIFLLTFSCKKTEPPAYLFISDKDFKINTDNFNKDHLTEYDNEELEAIRQQSFTSVLVSLRGKVLGYWQLPCTIPLLPDYNTENNILVTPCVKTRNLTENTEPYNFLKSEERFLTIEREGVYKFSDFHIDFEYAKNVTFPILETFSQTTSFKPNPRDTSKIRVPMEIYKNGEGASMGRIALEDTLMFFNVITSYIDLRPGYRHYWEMDYFCENGEMETYLDIKSPSTANPEFKLLILPATKSWKKIYIDLSEWVPLIAGSATKVSVGLGIMGKKNSDANAYFYFDNVKLISMPAPY